jgi:hypothetical protein
MITLDTLYVNNNTFINGNLNINNNKFFVFAPSE